MADPAIGTVDQATGYRFVGGQQRWAPLTGEDFADWLSQTKGPEVAAQIRQYANGELPLPSSRSPLYAQVMPYLLRYDPGASAATFPARVKARQHYTTGAGAAMITSLDTLGRHGIGLSNAIEGVGNYGPDARDPRPQGNALVSVQGLLNGIGPANNAVAHWIAGATGTDARLTRLRQEQKIFGTEFARILQGGAPHQGEVAAQAEGLNENGSPDAMRAYLQASAAAAIQRLEAQDAGFQRANGGSGGLSIFDMVDPRVVKALREIAATGHTSTRMESLTGYTPKASPMTQTTQVTPRTPPPAAAPPVNALAPRAAPPRAPTATRVAPQPQAGVSPALQSPQRPKSAADYLFGN